MGGKRHDHKVTPTTQSDIVTKLLGPPSKRDMSIAAIFTRKRAWKRLEQQQEDERERKRQQKRSEQRQRQAHRSVSQRTPETTDPPASQRNLDLMLALHRNGITRADDCLPVTTIPANLRWVLEEDDGPAEAEPWYDHLFPL